MQKWGMGIAFGYGRNGLLFGTGGNGTELRLVGTECAAAAHSGELGQHRRSGVETQGAGQGACTDRNPVPVPSRKMLPMQNSLWRSIWETLEQTAQQLVWDEGYSYAVKAQLVEMPFDDRTYGEWTMPARDYEALRITIGEAAGQNWWCVMYPSLCVPNACEVTADEETAQKAFGKSEQDMLQHHERYAVKLKCVEWLKQWF